VPVPPRANGKGKAIPGFEKRYNTDANCNMLQFARPRSGHSPVSARELRLHDTVAPGEQRFLVGMFRDPRARLWSAYNYDMHVVCCSGAGKAGEVGQAAPPVLAHMPSIVLRPRLAWRG